MATVTAAGRPGPGPHKDAEARVRRLDAALVGRRAGAWTCAAAAGRAACGRRSATGRRASSSPSVAAGPQPAAGTVTHAQVARHCVSTAARKNIPTRHLPTGLERLEPLFPAGLRPPLCP